MSLSNHPLQADGDTTTTAFVLSGGANLGAVQVGMLQALQERDITPDLIIGASAGAMNGAWLAGSAPGEPLDELAAIWRELSRRDVFPLGFGRGLAGFVGRRPSLFDPAGLRSLLSRHLRFNRLEEAAIPLHVVVTDVLDGSDVALCTGPAVDIVAASSSIPGIFPPVLVDGRPYTDGGVANNAPISHALRLGADRIYVLPTGYACSLETAPASALGMILHSVSLMVNRRLSLDVDRYLGAVDLRVVPAPCPVDIGPGDFSQGSALIERGYEVARDWLDESLDESIDESLDQSFDGSHGNPIAAHHQRHRG